MATGYVYSDGVFRPQPFENFQIGPAGGASVTVRDMARFMIGHLQAGRYAGGRILAEETAQLMHQWHFSNDPRLAGMAYGFYEVRVNGLVVVLLGVLAFALFDKQAFPDPPALARSRRAEARALYPGCIGCYRTAMVVQLLESAQLAILAAKRQAEASLPKTGGGFTPSGDAVDSC